VDLRRTGSAMSRRPHVAPLWSDRPDPLTALKLGEHVRLAEHTVDEAIDLQYEQRAYLARLERPIIRRRPVLVPASRPTRAQVPLTRHTEPVRELRTDVDPAAWARALKLAGGDEARLMVLAPTQILVMNRPCRG